MPSWTSQQFPELRGKKGGRGFVEEEAQPIEAGWAKASGALGSASLGRPAPGKPGGTGAHGLGLCGLGGGGNAELVALGVSLQPASRQSFDLQLPQFWRAFAPQRHGTLRDAQRLR